MGLPPYFDKAAIGAAQILRGYDYVEFKEYLQQSPVGVAFDHAAVVSRTALTTLELTVNLLARLYSTLILRSLEPDCAGISQGLADLARRINPNVEVCTDGAAAAWVVVGNKALSDTRGHTFYIGSDGWDAIISVSHPVCPGSADNPFGAAAAACIGAANVFRAIVGARYLPDSTLDTKGRLSLLDAVSAASRRPSPVPSVTLEDTVLVGAGAIGGAALWTLARCSTVTGDLHVVDPQTVDATNPQRYVLATLGDEGQSKVHLAKREFTGRPLKIVAHERAWAADEPVGGRWNWGLAAVAVDSARDRIAVQASLPRVVVNSWTQAGEAAVSRHRHFGVDACIACLYMPTATGRNEADIVAEEIGMPEAAKEVADMLVRQISLTAAFLNRIADAKNVPFERLAAYEGKTLHVFRNEVICGGLLLAARGGSDASTQLEVPMAFQSALAGVMLATEVVLHAAGMRNGFGRHSAVTRIDLLRALPSIVTFPEAPRLRCICADEDYQAAYRNKFAELTFA